VRLVMDCLVVVVVVVVVRLCTIYVFGDVRYLVTVNSFCVLQA
jgi:hypothetical protein